MSPLQLADELASIFPGLRGELHAPANLASLPKQFACFAAFTRVAVKANQVPLLLRCFAVADRLLRAADAPVAAAIRSAYFPSLHLDSLARGTQLACQLMPSHLHGAYLRHVYALAHEGSPAPALLFGNDPTKMGG